MILNERLKKMDDKEPYTITLNEVWDELLRLQYDIDDDYSDEQVETRETLRKLIGLLLEYFGSKVLGNVK